MQFDQSKQVYMLYVTNKKGFTCTSGISCTRNKVLSSKMIILSLCVRKPTIWVPTRFDTNRSVQSQKMVTGWKLWIKKVEELYYPYSENKGSNNNYIFF